MFGEYVSLYFWFLLGLFLWFGNVILNFYRYNFVKWYGDFMKFVICECMIDMVNEYWIVLVC